MIVKNEQIQLDSCLKSIRPYVAEICIVDTGSTDKTPEIAQKYADKFEVFLDCNNQDKDSPDYCKIENFAMARNRAFSLASNPWVFWIDGDDEVVGGEYLEDICRESDKIRGNHPYQLMLPYNYAHDANGKCICVHYRERLMSPISAFKWVNEVHEVCICQTPGLIQPSSDLVKIIHHRDGTGKTIESGRNLRILRKMYEKYGETDARHLYYLGLELGNNNLVDEALVMLKRYVELSGWDDEKYMACLKIIEHYMARGDYNSAIDWCLKATTVQEKWGEAYFQLAKCYYFLAKNGANPSRNWHKVVHFARVGLALPRTQTMLFVNPLERDLEIHKYLNVALNAIGDVKGAIESVRSGLEHSQDAGLVNNMRLYDRHLTIMDLNSGVDKLHGLGFIAKESAEVAKATISGLPVEHLNGTPRGDQAVTVVDSMWKQMVRHDNLIGASQLLTAVPWELRDNPAIEKLRRTTDHMITHWNDVKVGLNITIFVGQGVEPWNSITAKIHGIGGSETAVAEMATRLSALGHRVTVYGHCLSGDASLEGTFEGVTYLDSTKYGPHETDVLITSRRPEAVDESFGVKAKVRICWVHDVHCGQALTHERALKIDKFLCLTHWHKDFFLKTYPFVHPDQILVTRNGIDLSKFSEAIVKRNPHKAVYSSSPDRGLQVALSVWPSVRAQIPDAELHVYYGFDVWEKCSQGNKPQLDLIQSLKDAVKAGESNGVVYHGRVDQKFLANEFLGAGVWSYPTWFTETSCITAMEAQAAGLAIVTSPIAALNETVSSRGVLIGGDWLSPDYQNKFVGEIVKAMTSTTDKQRMKLKEYAFEHFGWDSLAKEWDMLLRQVIEEVELNVVPLYKSGK